MALKISRKPRIYVPTWNSNRDLPLDEQISAEYRTLSIEDVFTVQQKTDLNLMSGFNLSRDDPDSIRDYWKLVRWVLEHYVDAWKGIFADGIELIKSVDVIAALGTGQMDLLGEVFTEILRDSSGTETDVKNLQSESGQTSAGSDGPVLAVLPTDFNSSGTV